MTRALGLGATTLLVALAVAGPPRGSVAAADDVTLTLTAQPYTIEPGDPWTASFDVAGELGAAASPTAAPTTLTPSTAAAPPTTTAGRPLVQARVQAHRLVIDRAGLSEARAGDEPPIVSRATVPVDLVGTAEAASFQISVPTTNDPDVTGALLLARSGLYPVTVDLVIDGEIAASHRTFVERLPTTAPTDDAALQIAVVAAVDDPGPAPDASSLAAARRAVAGIVAAADALGGTISVQLPPSVLAGLDAAELGSLRGSLTGAELLAAPALALDPSSAVAAQQTETFSRQLRAGEDVLGEALSGTPQRSAWLVGPPLSAAAAATLRDPLGYDLLILERDFYDGLDGNIGGYHDPTLAVDIDLDFGASLPGIVVHPASRWLDPAERTTEEMSPTDAAIAIMAELRVTLRELGTDESRSAVLMTAAGSTPEPAVLEVLAGYATTTPDIRLGTLADLAATDVMDVPGRGPEVVQLPADAGIDLAERVSRIDLTRINAAGAGSMLLDASRATAVSNELDELLSTALGDAEVDARLADISAEAESVYRCIAMPNPFTITLTGRSSILRLNLGNECDQDLRVVVHPTSSKLTFPAGDIARTLPANSVTEVEIEVRSRSNGTSAIGVELLTPVGSLPLPQSLVLTARVNALSGLGQVVTGGALLVLGSWWYGHFRRRRRIRRAMLGEVDNPISITAVSPDAAEVTGPERSDADVAVPSDSVTEP